MAKEKDFNRLKVVLAEKKKTNKWLAEQLGKERNVWRLMLKTSSFLQKKKTLSFTRNDIQTNQMSKVSQ